MSQSLLSVVLVLLLSSYLCFSDEIYDRFDTEPGFPSVSHTLDQLLGNAQLVARVTIVSIYGRADHRADMQVVCTYKGQAQQKIIEVHGCNEGARGTKNIRVGDEDIIFANQSQSHSRVWKLNHYGLRGVWQQGEIMKILSLPSNSCQKVVNKANDKNARAGRSVIDNSLARCAQNISIDYRTKNTTCNEMPWHAFLWNHCNRETQCDAAVVGSSWVLTSARCVHQYTQHPRDLRLSLGINAAKNRSKSTRAKSVVLHPKWQPQSKNNTFYDMALVKFHRNVRPSTPPCPVRPICLPSIGQVAAPKHFFCYGIETNISEKSVRKLFLQPPAGAIRGVRPTANPEVLVNPVSRDQFRAKWAATACEARDGQWHLFQVLSASPETKRQVLSGSPETKRAPVLTDVNNADVLGWINDVMSDNGGTS